MPPRRSKRLVSAPNIANSDIMERLIAKKLENARKEQEEEEEDFPTEEDAPVAVAPRRAFNPCKDLYLLCRYVCMRVFGFR